MWRLGADGKTEEPPAWAERIRFWQDMDEGLATAAFEEVRKFELKYWTMVSNAENQDFWPPVAST